MPGRVVDLSVPGSTFPDPVIVDTNVIVEHLVAPFVPILPRSPVRANARRAAQFFRTLIATNGVGIVTPIAFAEVVHAAVKARYTQERLRLGPGARGASGRPISDWLALYKEDATILHAAVTAPKSFRPLGVQGIDSRPTVVYDATHRHSSTVDGRPSATDSSGDDPP